MEGEARSPVGQTAETGFEIGVRRTTPIGHAEAWRLVTSTEGVNLWLGPTSGIALEWGAIFHLDDGASGQVRVVTPGSHLRVSWQPGDWPRSSTIQVRVIPSGDRTVIAFHQEHIPNASSREARRSHFRSALDGLQRLVAERNSPTAKEQRDGPRSLDRTDGRPGGINRRYGA